MKDNYSFNVQDTIRRITCHFTNIEDFNLFCERNKVNLTPNTESYDWITKKITYNRLSGKYTPARECPEYQDMPIYETIEKESFMKILFSFPKDFSESEIDKIFDQKVGTQSFVYFPKFLGKQHTKFLMSDFDLKPKYPIYVVSRGRSESCFTSMFLSLMEIKHYVIVEPFEVQVYSEKLKEYSKFAEVLELDMSYKDNYDTCDDLGTKLNAGPGGARNFAWDHSVKNGFKYHWVMDDNVKDKGFAYTHANEKIIIKTSSFLRIHEDFVERFDNVALSGLQYLMFVPADRYSYPYILNTRIYSFLLIRNDIPYRWRGRFNEDTDLSLRALKDGWCTLEDQVFCADKIQTQRAKGGNNEVFYKELGTELKSKMLAELHPDVCRVVEKFHRIHHEVNYKGFKQKLHYRPDYVPKTGINNYGMYIINGEYADKKLSVSELKEKYKNAEKVDLNDLIPTSNETFKDFLSKKNLESLIW